MVTDALINGTSPARQLYDCAAAQYAEKKAGEAGKHKILYMQCNSVAYGFFAFVHLFGELQIVKKGGL